MWKLFGSKNILKKGNKKAPSKEGVERSEQVGMSAGA